MTTEGFARAVALNVAAALVAAWLLRQLPELRRLVTGDGAGCSCGRGPV